jgi:outer membrane autotransporter protein
MRASVNDSLAPIASRRSWKSGITANGIFIFFLLSLWIVPQVLKGQTLYWDLPGGTNPTPSGSWDTTSGNWSESAAGGGQTTWVQGSSAFFSATELGTPGSFNVTLAIPNVTVADLTYSGGAATSILEITGTANTITMATGAMNVTVDPGTTLVVDPAIIGTGNLNVNGGTLVLAGTNTYTGVTTITTGSLWLGNGGATGSIAGNVVDNANFSFNLSADIAFSQNISGTGSVSQRGTGVVTLTGTNTYSGGTFLLGFVPNVVGGTLSVASDAELGALTGAVTMNGGELLTTTNGFTGAHAFSVMPAIGVSTLAAASNTAAIYIGLFSGGGALTIGDPNNKGTVIFMADNTYSGVTAILAGVTLELGAGGSTGSTAGGVADSGTLSFNRNNGITFAGAISGPGNVIQVGTGTLTLTANNTYSGGTIIFGGGTVSVAADANLGAATGAVTLDNAGGELLTTGAAFNTSRAIVLGLATGADVLSAASGTTATYSGVVSGTGNLTVGGNLTLGPTPMGTLVLTGTSNYSGMTTVAAGTLQVDGQLSGTTAVGVQSGAILSGKGTILGGVTIAAGGHLAPGPGAQTLATGALTLSSGSLVDYTLSAPGVVGAGVNSLVIVTGNLTLAGATLNVTNGGNFGPGTYRLFDYTDGIAGTLTLGTLPTGFNSTNVTVSTTTPDQVNLIVGPALAPLQFWDGPNATFTGPAHGGDGTWNTTTTNFNNNVSGPNAVWQQNGIAVFGGTAGTVTLGVNIDFQSMHFTTDGYTVLGGGFQLFPTSAGVITTDSEVSVTISAPIAGTGSLTKAGPGTLILSGINTYNGGTQISGGVVSVSSNTALGVVQTGLGGIILSGGELLTTANGFSSGRTIQLNEGTDVLAAVNGTTATYTGPVSGTAGLVVGETNFGNTYGVVVLTNTANSYSNGTLIQGGETLSVASDLALGKPSGAITLQTGELVSTSNGFNSARSIFVTLPYGYHALAAATGTVATYSGIVSGAGFLQVGDGTNKGTVVLSGANTYQSETYVAGGATLSVENDGNLGNPSQFVGLMGGELLTTGKGFNTGRVIYLFSGDSNVLAATNGTSATYAGVVSSNGVLTVGDGTQTGTVILAGDNNYSGGTVVQSGTLVVDNAAALGTGNVTVNSAILATEVRPINVLANYAQNAGGTLQLRVAGANVGQYDSLNVRGNAILGGTLQLISAGFAPVAGNQLGLVSTGGTVSGRFAQLVDPFAVGPAFNTIDLVYGLNSVVLKFLKVAKPISPVVSTIDFQSFTAKATINQRASAGLLDQVELDPGAAAVTGFMFKEPEARFLADFSKISPDVLSSLDEIGFSNSNIQRLNLEDRLDAARNGSSGFSSNMNLSGAKVYLEQDGSVDDGKVDKNPLQPVMQPSPENRWGVWVSGFGDFVNIDGDGNGKGYDFTTGGVSVGVDFRLTDNLVIGLMGDYSHTWSNLKPGHLDVDSGRGGIYASWFARGFYLDGAVYAGHDSIDTGRAGLDGLASGGTDGSEWSAFLSSGYDFHIGHLTVGPIGALQYTEVNIDGFSEHGSVAPMAIHEGSEESLRSDIGFRALYQWQVGKVIIEPSLKAAWEHEYKYSALPITAGFADAPGPSGTFFGPSEGHDSAVVDAGVSVQWTQTLSTYISYDGQLGRGNYDSNAVTGGVKVAF